MVASDETSLFSGSCEISIAFRGKPAVVAPVATSNSAPEIPVTVEPELVYTMSKLPNKSAIGNAALPRISYMTFGSSIIQASMSDAFVLAG